MLGQALIATNDPACSRRGGGDAARMRVASEPESPTPMPSSPWPTAARATSPTPTSPPRRRRFARGDLRTARQLAARAKTRFPVGSPGWVKADDIASYKPPPEPQGRSEDVYD